LSGAATAQVIVASVVAVLTYWTLHRKLGIGLSFLRLVIRPAVGAITGGALAWLASEALDSIGVPLLQLVVGGIVGGLVCFVVGFSRQRRQDLLEPVRRRWARRRAARHRHETSKRELTSTGPAGTGR
jgi:membrane associated rhomboid family serine protease